MKDRDELYAIFLESFIENQCFFEGKLIWPEKRKLEDDIEEGFWHVITKDYTIDARLVDHRRAERLGWIRPLIEHYDDPSVKTWVSLHKGKTERVYIWIEDCDFLVVLEPMRNGKAFFLITAFYLDGTNAREKYMKRYNDRIR